jgi:hypothetical protein
MPYSAQTEKGIKNDPQRFNAGPMRGFDLGV